MGSLPMTRSDRLAQRLVDLARENGVVLLVDQHREPYARFPTNGRYATYAIHSRAFGSWLVWLYYESDRRVAGSGAVRSAQRILDILARHENVSTIAVASHYRVGGKDLEIIPVRSRSLEREVK